LVPSETLHAFAGIGANRFVTLDIPAGIGNGADALFDRGSGFFTISSAVEHLLAFIRSRGDETQQDGMHIAPLLASALAADIAPGRAPAPRQLTCAVDFLRRSYLRPIDGRDVALASGLSTARLHVVFRNWMGTSPGRYLAALRLDHARGQLARSGASIAEIALAAGFSEQSAFARAFRRRFGESPAACRRRTRSARPL
jgi:transcriptional regulator GlxA family with amidase domain